ATHRRVAPNGGRDAYEPMARPVPVTLLVTIPTADIAFETFVRDAFHDDSTPATLQVALRGRFPNAVVRPRVLSDEQFSVWYVYRDGGWRPVSDLNATPRT
ncbi:MAG TPA: hypothetical protein VLR93_08715, partial [Patescibacteria group bacterium]|nr:hypothetical protein [Patescibacteria group bacterium]